MFLRASIRFSSCLIFFNENVLVVFLISSSSPYLKSSFSKIGRPLKVNKGLLCIFPLGEIIIVTSIKPLFAIFFLSLIKEESSSIEIFHQHIICHLELYRKHEVFHLGIILQYLHSQLEQEKELAFP